AISLIPSPLKRNFFPQNYWVDFNGYLYQRLYSHEGGTTTDTIFGEFYANFGFAGVVPALFCTASLCSGFRWHSPNKNGGSLRRSRWQFSSLTILRKVPSRAWVRLSLWPHCGQLCFMRSSSPGACCRD